jgi:hypothetical protein
MIVNGFYFVKVAKECATDKARQSFVISCIKKLQFLGVVESPIVQ